MYIPIMLSRAYHCVSEACVHSENKSVDVCSPPVVFFLDFLFVPFLSPLLSSLPPKFSLYMNLEGPGSSVTISVGPACYKAKLEYF